MVRYRGLPNNRQIRQANNFKEGLDTQTSPFFLSENAFVDGYGWDFGDYPALKVRNGRTTYGTSGAATTRLLTNFGNVHLIRAVGTALQYWNGTAWTAITGTFTDTDWDAANFDILGPALILTNGTDVCKYWNGSALADITQMPKGLYVAADNRRVYTAGVSGDEDNIYFCAFQNALDWTTVENSGDRPFYTANGGPVTGLTSYNGAIWAFKKDAFAIIYHTGDSRITHRLVTISENIGCVSNKTIKQLGPYLFWLGNDNVYIGAGDAAQEIGDPIKRFLENINSSALSNACAFVDGEVYYLCIPTGSNTQPDTCLAYHYIFRKWLPYSISLGGLRFGAQLNNTAYTGDVNGQTFTMNSGTTDAGTAIPWRVQSRPFDDGDKSSEKELHHMYLQGYFPSGTSLTVEVSPDDIGASWETINYDPTTDSAATQNKRLIVPLDTVPLAFFYQYRISGTGPATIQEVQRLSRIQPLQL